MKKFILFISIFVSALFLSSCNNEELSDFQKLVKNIYDSEMVLVGYNETNSITDDGFEIYNKETAFKLERGEKIKSEVMIVEKRLSASGDSVYDETITNYKTVDNIKYTIVNGNTYENDYEMPTYYLTFVLAEDFLEEGYSLVVDGNNYTLSGKVIDNKISSLFLNKSVNSITNLVIEIVVEDNKLMSFKADYDSNTGNKVNISIEYLYAPIGKAKAVFYLEGGDCQNSKDRVSYVYTFNGSKIDTLIVDPNTLEKNELNKITKNGHHIEGWYQTKIVNPDGTVEYKDKWDFAKDRMGIAGVTLYAKWEIDRVYSYAVCYYDEFGNEVVLDSYEVNKGENFSDYFVETEIDGYTTVGYLDSEGNPWDEDYAHPGGDADITIKVYLKLIKGDYAVVKNARDFTSAISLNENIYVVSDIDFDGDEICFDKYSGTILGNGYELSNFEIDYDTSRNGLKVELDEFGNLSEESTLANHLYISLFFELSDAVIKDISFSDIFIEVKTTYSRIDVIVISPLAITAKNVKLENVKISGDITFTKTPDCEIKVEYDKFFYYTGSDVVIDDNSSVKITEE